MAQSASSKQAEITDWRATKKWFTHETWFLRLILKLLRIYYYPQLRLEKVGFENIPEGAAILAANHISGHDPTLMAIAFPKGRHIYPMGKKELFDQFEWPYRHLGAFPINRGGGLDSWAFDHVGKILAAGQICTIYAEGSRSGREKVELRRAKAGAARLAVRYQVPIVPCAIIGTEKLVTRKQLKGWRPITVRISLGKAIDVPAITGLDPTNQLIYREITNKVMYALAQMLPEENRGYYAQERTIRGREEKGDG